MVEEEEGIEKLQLAAVLLAAGLMLYLIADGRLDNRPPDHDNS